LSCFRHVLAFFWVTSWGDGFGYGYGKASGRALLESHQGAFIWFQQQLAWDRTVMCGLYITITYLLMNHGYLELFTSSFLQMASSLLTARPPHSTLWGGDQTILYDKQLIHDVLVHHYFPSLYASLSKTATANTLTKRRQPRCVAPLFYHRVQRLFSRRMRLPSHFRVRWKEGITSLFHGR
jgi:hypothetical protein